MEKFMIDNLTKKLYNSIMFNVKKYYEEIR